MAIEQRGISVERTWRQPKEATPPDPLTIQQVRFPNGVSWRVIQQPPERPDFVSDSAIKFTQFSNPKIHHVFALLAHNYNPTGESILRLQPGETIQLTLASGLDISYEITSIDTFQALSPNSVFSFFVDLNDRTSLSAAELFLRMYTNPDSLVLQTCIEANGNYCWGRLFVTAQPQ